MKQEKINNQFSVYGCGYRNPKGTAVLAVKPEGATDIAHVYQFIKSDQAKPATDRLREMVRQGATRDELSDYKKLNFRIATFSGSFSYRNAKSLIERSPYLVLDIDDLDSEAEARQLMDRLVSDPYVETELCFLSPKGRGIKWTSSYNSKPPGSMSSSTMAYPSTFPGQMSAAPAFCHMTRFAT